MPNIVIKTERLLLRPLTVNDADAVYEWVSDERVTRYMNYLTYTSIVQVREWLISIAEDMATYHFGFERISDGKLIGSVDISPDGNTVYWRFGYNIRYDCWGNGYATEAARAMMDYVRGGIWCDTFSCKPCGTQSCIRLCD